MAIINTFSKRQKKLSQATKPQPYQYDEIPSAFRVQVIHIWNTAIGNYFIDQYGIHPSPPSNQIWDFLHQQMAREKGVHYLGDGYSDLKAQVLQFIEQGTTEDVLDIIEMSFQVMIVYVTRFNDYHKEESGIEQSPDDAIEELNERFKEHNLGFQFMNNQLISINSEFIHEQVVTPALKLLHDSGFNGAEEEFLKAHEHCRHSRDKEAITEALKAFESTMKSICDQRQWTYSTGATAKPLIDILIKNGLIPTELSSHFDGLRSAMESGLPTLRNRNSGHGQGSTPKNVPPYFAFYAIHLAASNIVFLVEANRALSVRGQK